MADNHAESTPEKQSTATELLHGIEGDGGGEDVDNSGDHADEEGVIDGAELQSLALVKTKRKAERTYRLEEGGSEVEDEVNTSPLLHHLKRSTENSTTEVAVGREEAALEAAHPGGEVSTLGHRLHLVFVVGNNLGQFLFDVIRVLRLTSHTRQDVGGLFELVLAHKVTRRLGKNEQTNGEDQGPEHLQRNGNSVRPGVRAILSTVVDAGSQHQTDGDAELVSRDNGTADLAGRDLRHVENDDGRDETDTETGDQTTDDQQGDGSGGRLENNTDNENTTSSDDGCPTPEPIGQITSDESTEECTGREDGCDERFLPGGNDEGVFGCSVVVLLTRGLVDGSGKSHDCRMRLPVPRTPR